VRRTARDALRRCGVRRCGVGRSAASLVCAILAALLLSAPVSADINANIKAKQDQLQSVQAQLERKRRQLGAATTKVNTVQAQLDETTHSISTVAAWLADLDGQVGWNRKQLAWNATQLQAAQSSLDRHTDALRHRLVAAYEYGELGYLNVLLASNSFSDLAERWEDIRLLIAQNERTVRERREAQTRVAAIERDLHTAQGRLDTALAREQQVQYQLDALAGQRRQLLAVAAGERQVVAQQVASLDETSTAEQAALQALIVERQREEEARREAARRAAMLSGEAPPPASGPGEFSWPASGPITSPFGYRADPYGSGRSDFHPGIDIGAPMGATITAAADGRVIFAGWYGGYGNAIIIDHGGGVSTLYGHCSQIFVSEHQDVQRGQAIGAVGSTGHSTGPHVHFEVRQNGTPVDPLTRLR